MQSLALICSSVMPHLKQRLLSPLFPAGTLYAQAYILIDTPPQEGYRSIAFHLSRW